MILVLLIGLGLAGLAVAALARALTFPRARTADLLTQIQTYGFTVRADDATEAGGAVRGALDSIASTLGSLFGPRLGRGSAEGDLRTKLMSAGLYTVAPRRFTGYRVLATIFTPIAWLWASSCAGISPALVVVGVVLGTLAGWQAPMVMVNNRIRHRFERIEYDLPELIDLLVVTIEAGTGFSGSLQLAASRLEGPLGDELRLTVQEQTLGLSTDEALRNLLERCDTPAVRSFVRSVLQGEALGVSIGQIMRNLASEMRKRRRAMAEERAQKAPIKILFPLIFFIFPAMFIVLLAPAVMTFVEAIRGK
jgi:tight adherence protein C